VWLGQAVKEPYAIARSGNTTYLQELKMETIAREGEGVLRKLATWDKKSLAANL
jgi:hypothetical protein